MTSAPYTLLVNTCDSFRDCWRPFFHLLNAYWPEAQKIPVVLNTETLECTQGGPNVISSKAAIVGGQVRLKMPWSELLIRALALVRTPLVLYLQEDYFLQRRVRSDLIGRLAERMLQQPEIRHIGLTHFGAYGPFEKTADDLLWEIKPRARYRISTQAALWRVETLKSYLFAPENAWMFEQFGTLRAWRRKDLFLTVNRDRHGREPDRIMDYLGTGIMKGQWHSGAPELFARHGIPMDFERRGFYTTRTKLQSRWETFAALTRNPSIALRSAVKTLVAP